MSVDRLERDRQNNYMHSGQEDFWMMHVIALGQLLGDPSERLQVAPHDRVEENAGVLLGVPGRDVDNVGLHDHGPCLVAPVCGRVKGGD